MGQTIQCTHKITYCILHPATVYFFIFCVDAALLVACAPSELLPMKIRPAELAWPWGLHSGRVLSTLYRL